ncbi:MAG: EscU/YscU/HrcU family type III secretion system export apparatus switch protein [Acidimicrobiales bacterium]
MAGAGGEKTEKPTPKRLREARKKGQIPKSVDLIQWLVLLMSTWFIPPLIRNLGISMRAETTTLMHAAATGEMGLVTERLDDILWLMTRSLLPLFGLVCLTIVVGLGLQGGVVLSTEGIKPKPERISPKAGFKRLFSSEPLVDTVKSIVRLLVLAVLSATVLRSILEEHLLPIPVALDAAALRLGDQMLSLVRMVAFAGLLVGGGDYAYQRWKIGKQLKMSKEEIKQEYKQAEGDPQMKGRRRQAHAKLTRNQMLAAVDDASAVVVNPTHVAVAIKYQEGTGAPRVVAKGGDELAMRIRERAKAKGVPIVEARPLARILHDRVEVGETIPNELFRAIAIVLAFVMRNPNTSFSDTIRRVKIPASAMRMPDEDPVEAQKRRRRRAA